MRAVILAIMIAFFASTAHARIFAPASCGELSSTDLRTEMINQIEDRTIGVTADDTTKLIFTTQGDSTGGWVRNPSVWSSGGATPINLTGLSPWNSYNLNRRAGTLISPRHIVMANHYYIPNGYTIVFVDGNNNVITRTVVSSVRIGTTDIRIGVLDSDVPSSIEYYPVLSSTDLQNYLSKFKFPALNTDQEEKALTLEMDHYQAAFNGLEYIGTVIPNVFVYYQSPFGTSRSSFFETLIAGDSGNPAMAVIDNQPAVLLTFYEATASTNLGYYISEINSAMTSLGGGYQLSTYDLSCFSSYANRTPSFVSGNSFSTFESVPNGSTVGRVVFSDPDYTSPQYSIVAGNTGNAFAISTSTGIITVADNNMLNHDTNPTFTLTIQADNVAWWNATSSASVDVTINVNRRKFVISMPVNYIALNNGLIGWWTMDGKDTTWTSATTGTVADRSGNGNTGTLTNMNQSTSPVAGKVGQALGFDGSNDYVITPLVLSNSQPFTVSAWIKWTGTSSGIIFSQDSTGSNDIGLQYAVGTGFVYQNVAHAVDQNTNFGPANLDHNWHHIVIVEKYTTDVDDNDYYIDNIKYASAGGSTVNPSNTTFEIGSRNTGSVVWAGYIDDVRVYNRALSASEIEQLYGGSSAKHHVSLYGGSGLTSGLVGWWTMDGKDTTWTSATTGTVADRSGNGNTGTLTNMNQSTSPVAGKVGQGFKFTASGDKVNINSDVLGTGAMTISAWVFPDGNGGRIMSNTSGKTDYSIEGANDRLVLYSTASARSAIGSVPKRKWSHVVVTRDSSANANFYVNGVLSGTPNQTTGTPGAGGTYTNISATSGGFNGVIDDVRVYSRVLSASEIQQLYNMGK